MLPEITGGKRYAKFIPKTDSTTGCGCHARSKGTLGCHCKAAAQSGATGRYGRSARRDHRLCGNCAAQKSRFDILRRQRHCGGRRHADLPGSHRRRHPKLYQRHRFGQCAFPCVRRRCLSRGYRRCRTTELSRCHRLQNRAGYKKFCERTGNDPGAGGMCHLCRYCTCTGKSCRRI